MDYIIDGYGKKREAKLVICDNCFNPFLKAKRFLKQKKGNFCSPLCNNRSRRVKRVKVNCLYCNKEKEITIRKYNKSKYKIFFCNRVCQSEAQNSNNDIDYICNFIDGNTTYRQKAFNFYPHECEICGYDEHLRVLEVHHIDFDRTNNEIKNLIILCPTCHVPLTRKYAILENRKIIWLFYMGH